ncbi:MAG: tetratricopeptide repeat protein [Anaerolineae bacterium]|nr:tetratricopeptide repeat protein [Anaerolineae bacterium]
MPRAARYGAFLAGLVVVALACLSGCADRADAEGLYRAGLIAMERGRYRTAVRCFGQVAKLDPPGITRGYEQRAEAYLRWGKYRRAIKDWSRLIEIWPEQPSAYLGRALAYERMNKPEEALPDYRKVLELPDRGHHALARQRLGELEGHP